MTQQEKEIKSLQEMIDSCFTYGGADRDSYNFERYIKPYQEKVGEPFDAVYEEHLKCLKENYRVVPNVYTDCEGCSYNQLIRKDQ